MTKHPEIFAALAGPFEPHEIRVREQAGRKFHYITARVAMNRLDNVLGPENWWDEYQAHENSVDCRLTIRLPDGSTVTKCDAGGMAGMADSGDDDKSGYSDAFKRAAVKFGVGRYLYRDGVPRFAMEKYGDVPNDHPPAQAHHVNEPRQAPPSAEHRPTAPHSNGNGHGAPRSGKALFAWVKEMEQTHEVGLLKYLNGWAKLQDFSSRMVDWDNDQVAMAHAEGLRKIAAVTPGKTDGGSPQVQGDDPGRFPQNKPGFTNNTGHKSGKYASDAETDAYKAWLARYVEEVNAKWIDHWTDPKTHELPNGIGDLINVWRLSNHLCKWLRETGMIQAPEDFKVAQTDRLVAIVHAADRPVVEGDARVYCRKLWGEEKARIEAGEPQGAEDAEPDDDGADAESDNIETTEAGSRG